MTHENKRAILEMRLAGYTLQEIADKIGTTRQNVSLFLRGLATERKKGFKPFVCVYPGLKAWMYKNRVSITKLIDDIKVLKCYQSLYRRMNGEVEFELSEIKAILAYTGLTFDEAFGVVEDAPGGDTNGSEQQAEGSTV